MKIDLKDHQIVVKRIDRLAAELVPIFDKLPCEARSAVVDLGLTLFDLRERLTADDSEPQFNGLALAG